ncbi:MAG: beta-phosphoglucomutase [Bacteroidetes bacterium]|nr:beta-phosphoglucomutase [Bacteroidota bacterium]
MSKVKALIFDLDGVIVDTAKYHYKAWKALANSLGFDFTEQDNELLKGVSRVRSLEILLEIGGKNFDEQKKIEFANRKNSEYVGYISQMTPDEILPGVTEMLQSVKDAGLKIVLGSASKNAPLILEKINLEHFFDAVIDGNKVSKAKPDPEVFLKGANAANVDPEQCIVFEDAIAGIEAAQNAKMKTIGVGDPQVLRNADAVISGFAGLTVHELLKMV